MTEISFETHPDRYKHWNLSVDGPLARLTMDVELHGGLRDDYELKLNSYDLSVDIELADAVQRMRFEHPEVRTVIVESAIDRCFCAGANIPMLGSSTHSFKVNFCKFTNETRLYIEDASKHSGQKYLAAVSGACAGGGYELALACDEILLIDDGSSTVSLPEVPLLAVLPGTGGLTRLVDKRKIRRDRADIFCTTEEGMRGKRAIDWGLVDGIAPRSKFDDAVKERAEALAALSDDITKGPGITLDPLAPKVDEGTLAYRHVTARINSDKRTAELTVAAPTTAQPKTADEVQQAGADQWSLRVFRELDDALLRLRVNHGEIGLVVVKTRGDQAAVLAADQGLRDNKSHWLANEILRFQARVLRRFDYTSKSFFALADEGSCFAGCLFELLVASDRSYMLLDDDEQVAVRVGPNNGDTYPMGTGISRLEAHFYGDPSQVGKILELDEAIATEKAEELGLITVAADDIDWDDDVRIAIEERVAMSPDSLTGMEASLRFPGPETTESKIFARLSAWQNWIFQRPNAVGPQGALTKYGQPDRAVFDYRRC
ncbi:MAG: benzoyl-CoA-dihydrodiol lyase [Deltaproteobacteria bacterium]|nr:benzoyl-CoA-dihydrodiol lyase [Deltaproteobacteria bacterium]